MDFTAQSHFVDVGKDGARLHLRRFQPRSPGEPVLLVHGAIENGRIFYSESGRGLAPFLARAGFDCFVADLRGRGQSTPPIGPGAAFGQTEAITEDLPALAAAVGALTANKPQHWIAHSWGGVLMAAHLARFPERRATVASLTFFASKRRITVRNWPAFWQIEVFWKRLFPLVARVKGFLPARELRFGVDQETRGSLAASIAWVRPRAPFVDWEDGFDYGAALAAAPLPRTRHYAGSLDQFLGHPLDIALFMAECGTPPAALRVLAGFGHNDLLTRADAVTTHFPEVATWLSSPSC